MISTIIFNFDVFIELHKDAPAFAFSNLGLTQWYDDLEELRINFEKGKATELQFIEGFQKYLPDASIEDVRNAWNSIYPVYPNVPIPLNRLEFLQLLTNNYQLILMGNIDPMRIEKFQHSAGMSFYRDFYQCFEQIYFSYELGMRSPDPEFFNYIVRKHDLSPKRTLYVDDSKENTDVAASLGLEIWNIQLDKEDVVDLPKKEFQ